MSAPLKIPETDFYACDDTENLTHTDPNEAIADFLDRYQTPGCDVLAECPETVTLRCYCRMKPAPGRYVDAALDQLLEALDEEYAEPGGDPTTHTTAALVRMQTAARDFCEAVIAEYRPWACETFYTIEVDTETWIRTHTPEWLTPPTPRMGRPS